MSVKFTFRRVDSNAIVRLSFFAHDVCVVYCCTVAAAAAAAAKDVLSIILISCRYHQAQFDVSNS